MINGKSFVIAPEALDGMDSERLHSGSYINRYDGLSVTVSEDKRYALIGDCWSIREGEDPESVIADGTESVAEILEREYYWCGRYILLLDDMIYMDAAGMMSVFYGGGYISNSLNLIRELLGLGLKKEKLYPGLLPDFVPGVDTLYDGVKRLLPGFSYNIVENKLSHRALLPNAPVELESEEERVRVFCEEFASCLKNMCRHFDGKTMMIACTGGRDSRATVAGFEYAGLPYELFLLEHDEISDADVELSRRVSGAMGKKLHYIKRNKADFSADKQAAFDRHTCNYVVDADREFCAYGQYDRLISEIGGEMVILRGSVWPIICERFDGIPVDKIGSLYSALDFNKSFRESTDSWKKLVSDDDLNGNIGDANRIFWELREGCCVSSIEQAFDIYDELSPIQPVNCRRLLSLLFGFDKQSRMAKTHEEKLTRFMCSELDSIPYDYQTKMMPKDNKLKSIAALSKKAMWVLFNYGPVPLIKIIKNKY